MFLSWKAFALSCSVILLHCILVGGGLIRSEKVSEAVYVSSDWLGPCLMWLTPVVVLTNSEGSVSFCVHLFFVLGVLFFNISFKNTDSVWTHTHKSCCTFAEFTDSGREGVFVLVLQITPCWFFWQVHWFIKVLTVLEQKKIHTSPS